MSDDVFDARTRRKKGGQGARAQAPRPRRGSSDTFSLMVAARRTGRLRQGIKKRGHLTRAWPSRPRFAFGNTLLYARPPPLPAQGPPRSLPAQDAERGCGAQRRRAGRRCCEGSLAVRCSVLRAHRRARSEASITQCVARILRRAPLPRRTSRHLSPPRERVTARDVSGEPAAIFEAYVSKWRAGCRGGVEGAETGSPRRWRVRGKDPSWKGSPRCRLMGLPRT